MASRCISQIGRGGGATFCQLLTVCCSSLNAYQDLPRWLEVGDDMPFTVAVQRPIAVGVKKNARACHNLQTFCNGVHNSASPASLRGDILHNLVSSLVTSFSKTGGP